LTLPGLHRQSMEMLHFRTSLCCKTGYEFEQYYKATEAGQRYRWVCDIIGCCVC